MVVKNKFILYQMLPRVFGQRDWEPGGTFERNGSGKFADITADYLEGLHRDLNIGAVWYTGVIAHATKTVFPGIEPTHPDLVKGEAGSPYAICDYFDVAAELATDIKGRMQEFRDLAERTHRAGMKVVIDFVPNHIFRQFRLPFTVSNFYPLYGQSLKLPIETDYRENPALGSGNCPGNPAPGVCDWYDTVKLNYENKYTWNIMRDVLLFWLSQGVDGFRCDMAELVPADFFRWVFAIVRGKYPDAFFIAEIYDKGNYRRYADSGFDYLYDKSGFYDALREVCGGNRPAYWLTDEWQFLGDLQPRMLNFLENHDEQRLASDFFLGSGRKAMAPLAVSLLFNTAPFMLYFGQEYGERGMQREGYSGLDGRTSIYDYCSLSKEKDSWLYGRYREMLALAADPLFAAGKTFDLMYRNPAGDHFDSRRQFAFMRGHGGRGALVAANFAPNPVDITLEIPSEAWDYLGVAPCAAFEGPIHIEANDCAILLTHNQ